MDTLGIIKVPSGKVTLQSNRKKWIKTLNKEIKELLLKYSKQNLQLEPSITGIDSTNIIDKSEAISASTLRKEILKELLKCIHQDLFLLTTKVF